MKAIRGCYSSCKLYFPCSLFALADDVHRLEAFSAILLRNLAENPNLVYNLVRAHKTFEDLGTFTLARGLREIRRIQLAREERGGRNSSDKPKSRTNSSDTERPGSEKARLLRSESATSIELSQADLPDDIEAQRQATADESRPGRLPRTSSTASSPTSESPRLPSEKARGKMRAGRIVAEEMTGSLERLAASGVGRNGFVPTQEWVTSWQQGLVLSRFDHSFRPAHTRRCSLPLDVVMIVTSELLSKIQGLQSSLTGATANTAIVDLLRNAALSEHLPKPPALAPRRFVVRDFRPKALIQSLKSSPQWTDASVVWLTSLIWGEIYVRGMTPLGIWNSTSVRLFYVKHTQVQHRQITETVSNVVGGLLGRTESSQSVRQRQ